MVGSAVTAEEIFTNFWNWLPPVGVEHQINRDPAYKTWFTDVLDSLQSYGHNVCIGTEIPVLLNNWCIHLLLWITWKHRPSMNVKTCYSNNTGSKPVF